MTKELRKFWGRIEKQVLSIMVQSWDNELGSFYLNRVNTFLHESQEDYYNLLYKFNKKQYDSSAQATRLRVRDQYHKVSTKDYITIKEISKLFKPNEKVTSSLRSKVFQSSQSTMARVDKNITKIISDGYHEGKGINEVSSMIRNEFNSLKTWESERIARTEINTANNLASYEAYDGMNVDYHQWWTGEDDLVRDSHEELHGKIVKVGDTFSNGLEFPGDTSGDLSEWINCRCTTVPFVMPLGMMAPPGVSEFTEDELVEIPGFEKPSLEEALQMLQEENSDIISNIPEVPNIETPTMQFSFSKEEQALYNELKPLYDNEQLGFLERVKYSELESQLEFNDLWLKRDTLEEGSKEFKQFKKLYSNLEEKLSLQPSKEFFINESNLKLVPNKYALTSEQKLRLKELETNGPNGFIEKRELKKLNAQSEFNELWSKRATQELSFEEEKEFKSLWAKLRENLELPKYDEFFAKPKPQTPKIVKPREKTIWDKNVEKLEKTVTSEIKGETFTSKHEIAQEYTEKLVLKQNLKGEERDIVIKWSGDANAAMNALNRGETAIDLGEFHSVNEIKQANKALSDTINGLKPSQCIQENTTLFRGVEEQWVDLSKFEVGEVNSFREFTSTSFDVGVAEEFSQYNYGEGYIFKIHAPSGTKGIAIDNVNIGNSSEERELLLNKGQKYITQNVDKENKIIELLLVN